MTSLASLWLPILVSAVIVFVASAIVHMLLTYHKSDYRPVPREDQFRSAVRPLAVPPGDYMVPCAASMKESKSEAFQAKWREGPNMLLTVLPTSDMGMGRSLALWFVYLVIVALFVAYIASRTLAPGTDYLQVFRVTGASSFLALGFSLWNHTIWMQRSAKTAMKDTIDALIYALLVGGTFGWLWP